MSPTTASRIVASAAQVATPLDDGLVLLGLEAGRYFSTNAVGRRIWEEIQEPITLDDLVARLAGEFHVDAARLRGDVEAFVATLTDAGLARVPPDA